MKLGITSAIMLLGVATLALPVHAQNDTTLSDGATDGDNPSTTVICRRYPPPTGSRIGARRICRTEAQWVQHDTEHRLAIEREQRNRVGCPGSAGPLGQSSGRLAPAC